MKTKKIPMRRCAGCMESKPKQEMTRIAFYEGRLTVDLTGRAPGRGVYLCSDPVCRETAKKKRALQRSFKTNISVSETDRIFEELEQSDERR